MVALAAVRPPTGAASSSAAAAFEAVPHEVAIGEGKVEAIGVSEEAADAGVTDRRGGT